MTTPAVERLRGIADMARGIPGRMGLYEHAATLTLDVWSASSGVSGAQPGEGTYVESLVPLVVATAQNPRIRWLTDKECAIGSIPAGTVEIGPLTPQHSAGGVNVAKVLGTAMVAGETRFIRVQGPRVPDGARYRVSSIEADKALKLVIRCEPAGT